MDIISYSKAKKAKYAVREVNKHIGHTNEYKHGLGDVNGNFTTADERLTNMELKAAPSILNRRISDMSAITMVNLNKHNLKVKTLLNSNRYGHKNMVFDDFKDTTNINTSATSNIAYDTNNGIIKVYNKNLPGSLIIKGPQSPVRAIAISLAVKDNRTFEQALKKNSIQFEADENGFYKQEGTFYSDVYLIDKLSTLDNVEITNAGTATVNVFYALGTYLESPFDKWEPFNKVEVEGGTYVKLRYDVINQITSESYLYKNEVVLSDMKANKLGSGIRIDSNAAPHEIEPLRIISDNDGGIVSLNTLRTIGTVAVNKLKEIMVADILSTKDRELEYNNGQSITLAKTVHKYRPYVINPLTIRETENLEKTLYNLSIPKQAKYQSKIDLRFAIQGEDIQLNGSGTLTIRKRVK